MWVLVKHLLVYYYPALPLTGICAIVAANCCCPADAATPAVAVGYSVPTAVVVAAVVVPIVHHVAVAVVGSTVVVGLVLAGSSGGIVLAVE